MGIFVEISLGEFIDRMTILEIKAEELPTAVRAAAQKELQALRSAKRREVANVDGLERLAGELRSVNRALWNVEEALREFERVGRFGEAFIQAARSVYRLNDRRAAIKRGIDKLLGSSCVELKSFELPELT